MSDRRKTPGITFAVTLVIAVAAVVIALWGRAS